MNIKFRQGWTQIRPKMGDIQFFRLTWDFGEYTLPNESYFAIELTVFNFSIQIDIG